MNSKIILAAVVASTVAFTAAHANEAARFELTNASGLQIDGIYVAPAGSPTLGRDLLGDRVLRAGGTVTVTPGGQGCRYNVQVAYHGGGTEWFRNVDLCRTTRITFANTADAYMN